MFRALKQLVMTELQSNGDETSTVQMFNDKKRIKTIRAEKITEKIEREDKWNGEKIQSLNRFKFLLLPMIKSLETKFCF